MIEHTVLNAAEYRTNCLLDLDAGDFVPPPLALNLTNREAVWFWAAAAGVDVAGTVTPEQAGLLGFQLGMVLLTEEDWEKADPVLSGN